MKQETVINLEQQGDITIFDIKGDVTAFSEPFFKEAYQKANAQSIRKLLLKFDEDAYINSGGIAIIISMVAEARKKNQKVGVCSLSDHFVKIFDMIVLTDYVEMYPTEEEALKAL